MGLLDRSSERTTFPAVLLALASLGTPAGAAPVDGSGLPVDRREGADGASVEATAAEVGDARAESTDADAVDPATMALEEEGVDELLLWTMADTVTLDGRMLRNLRGDFVGRLERVAERMWNEHGMRVELVEGYRTPDRQQELFAQGRSVEGPVVTWTRNSLHSRGAAADVMVDGAPISESQAVLLARIAREEGLQTLYPFDSGHIQLDGVRNTGPEGPLPRTPASDQGGVAAPRPGVAPVAPVARPARPARPGGVGEPVADASDGKGSTSVVPDGTVRPEREGAISLAALGLRPSAQKRSGSDTPRLASDPRPGGTSAEGSRAAPVSPSATVGTRRAATAAGESGHPSGGIAEGRATPPDGEKGEQGRSTRDGRSLSGLAGRTDRSEAKAGTTTGSVAARASAVDDAGPGAPGTGPARRREAESRSVAADASGEGTARNASPAHAGLGGYGADAAREISATARSAVASRTFEPSAYVARLEGAEGPVYRRLHLPIEGLDGHGSLQIGVRPGAIDASLNLSDARLAADIQRNLHQLRQVLASRGIETAGLSVRVVSDGGVAQAAPTAVGDAVPTLAAESPSSGGSSSDGGSRQSADRSQEKAEERRQNARSRRDRQEEKNR